MRLQPTALAYGTWKQCHANKLQHIWLLHAVGMRLHPTALAYGTWKQCHANKLHYIWLQHAVGDAAATDCLGVQQLETMSRKQATTYLVAACSRGGDYNPLPWHTAAGNNVTQTSYNIFGCNMQSGMRLHPTALAHGSWKQCHANKLQHIWLQHAVGDEAATDCLGVRQLETMSHKQATQYLVAARSRG